MWGTSGGFLQPVLMTKDTAHRDLIELVVVAVRNHSVIKEIVLAGKLTSYAQRHGLAWEMKTSKTQVPSLHNSENGFGDSASEEDT